VNCVLHLQCSFSFGGGGIISPPSVLNYVVP
jgi:hypothetical protein